MLAALLSRLPQLPLKSTLGEWRPTSTLTEAEIREAWLHRSRFLGLRAHVDPDYDYQYFSRVVRDCRTAWLLRDAQGTLRGTGFLGETTYECQGQALQWIIGEYFFIDEALRPNLGFSMWLGTGLLHAFANAKGRRIFTGGAGYPPSVLTLCRVAEPVWIGAGEPIPLWEAAARDMLGKEAGWNKETGIVELRTYNLNPWTRPPRDERLRRYWDRYQEVAPHWTQGSVPFAFAELKLSSFLSGALPLLAKRLRRR